tara:strand:- start:2879 stop:3652 length:774 start_codon:yes stop_codon:yes gene_type:complete
MSKKENYKNIWIVGTGRSGTHFLCRSLLCYENIIDYLDGNENKKLLIDIRESILQNKSINSSVLKYYEKIINKTMENNKIFIDQHHPNIWNFKALIENFPHSLFIFVNRDIKQIVSSMLNHKSIYSNLKILIKNPETIYYPSQFYGIEKKELLKEYNIIELCALRVQSHKLRAKILSEDYPDNFIIINFDDLVLNKNILFNMIFSKFKFQDLGVFKDNIVVNNKVLTKYESNLSKLDIETLNNYEIKLKSIDINDNL